MTSIHKFDSGLLDTSGAQTWDNIGTNKDGPEGRVLAHSTGSPGPRQSLKWSDRLMAILPETDSTVTPPPDVFLSRMATLDGCPECVLNVEPPSSVHDDPPRGFLANYVCMVCGHAWTTAWRDR